MMQVISALVGFGIEATDGPLGSVVDFLFDDSTWNVRWLVVECGSWLRGNRVLIHPSAIVANDFDGERFDVKLSKSQVSGSPEWTEDRPVSKQMETRLYNYYGWDPQWGAAFLGGDLGAMATPLMGPPLLGFSQISDAIGEGEQRADDDAHLRSYIELVGYRVHAADGEIGHIENFMLDETNWRLSYLIIDTNNWWFGKRVLISTAVVNNIEWVDRRVRLDVSCAVVKSGPIWDPLIAFSQIDVAKLQKHYNWPGSRA